ncbi:MULTISPECIES: hypothetical protein [unclassified Nocardioides]|uniref:hypothetical protein n=1 Tax=unclassified Nocardioides TaxID=2615069 RepID=UPI00070247A3|nr:MULTISPECIES: hypothetical protein [unclassified Nocardioides]KRC53389.1 hypothetical protein ASE19_13665 [Nocardioides sp. Root79]KRC68136.1 hypothetical protein ASE20_19090 [Nocardioides sp. Root240]
MKLSLVRRLATGFLFLDVLVIGAAAVQVDAVVAQTVTAPPVGAAPAPTPLPVDGLAPAAVPEWPGAPLPASVPLGDGGVPQAAAPVPPVTPSGTDEPSSGGKGSTPPTAPPEEGGVPAGPGIPPCPIRLSEHPQSGGLQSLVPFAPAFGPFSAEAFALASAYQPELQLLGPILAQYPGIEPAVEPILTPLVSTLGTLLTRGLDVINPLYGPYRTRFLEAETKLAAALAPYSQALAHNALGGCIVELQSALLTASRTGTPGVPRPTALDLTALGLGGLL